MGLDFVVVYVCLTIDSLEELFLFPKYLSLHFALEQCQLIQNAFDRYMDNGFRIWAKDLGVTLFLKALNKLHGKLNIR